MEWWKRFKTFLTEVVVETKKVTWPTKQEVINTTTVVVVASFIFGIYLYLCDLVFVFLTRKIFRGPLMAKQWYIIHTYSGFEDRVKKTLEQRVEALGMDEFFGEVRVPTETVVEVKNGKKREVRRKFFPGYVLVEMEMTDDAWHLVRNTPKVTGFVGAGKKPTPLTEEEVNQILHQSVATQEKPRPKEMFEKGERIKITDGPFATFNGVVEEVNLDRSTLKVMVTIFGRETPVEMEFRQVQKLT